MESTSTGFWIAIAIGGAIIAILSAVQQYTSKASEFSVKPVARDFCIGAFLTAAVYMMIPDSIQSLLTQAQGLMKSSGTDVELQTGPARF